MCLWDSVGVGWVVGRLIWAWFRWASSASCVFLEPEDLAGDGRGGREHVQVQKHFQSLCVHPMG